MTRLPSESVDLIVTSPPFPLTFRKRRPYTSVGEDAFVGWFLPYAKECHRLLKQTGSCAIDLGGVWNKGTPTKSLYQYRLVIALCDQLGFHYAQDFCWYNPAALPAPAEWVNVRRIRVKSAVDVVFWLGKSDSPRASNREVLRAYSRDMLRLIERGYRAKERPSGHNITNKFPELFIKLCTQRGDTVLDPFAGSNVTGEAAERLGRRWIAVELAEEYLKRSRFRFLRRDLPLFAHPTSRKRA